MALLGRDIERRRLSTLVESVRDGHSAALVIRGEAGIGKSALLEHLVSLAQDLRLIRLTAVESDGELPYAGLQQLSAPILHLRGRLPAPQREALGVAFGPENGTAPNRFLVGLATLNLLSEAGRERPALFVVDDAQWLDRESALVLAFVARRLLMESALLVFAAREAETVFAGLPELTVEGLADTDARDLIAQAVHGPLDPRVRDLVVAEARGNPLALLELPRRLTAVELAGGYSVLELSGAPGAMEQGFRRQVATLPTATQLLLLTAAADSLGSPVALWRAAKRLGIGQEAVTAARDAGLLEIGTRVVFRHPLVRSAVYRAASVEDRRRAHAVLAELIDPAREPERRAWHRAQAAPGTDEVIAGELEQAAGRARARGGAAAAAAFLERAAALTSDPATRAVRELDAAEAKLEAGGIDAAESLVAVAETELTEPRQQARALILRGHVAFARSFGRAAPPLLLDAALLLEPIDALAARETYLEALCAALLAGREADRGSVLEVARAAFQSACGSPVSERPADLLLAGLVTFVTQGAAAGAESLRLALDAFHDEAVPAEAKLRWLWPVGHAAGLLWDLGGWDHSSALHLSLAREAGLLAVMPVALNTRAGFHLFTGELSAAAALAEEEAMVADLTGGRIAPYGALGTAAYAGREAEAARLIATGRQDAVQRGEGVGTTFIDWAAALLFNGLGRYEEAREAARRAADDIPAQRFGNWALSELVEAAMRSDRPKEASAAMERLAQATAVSSSDWALGIAARSRALLSSGRVAEELYIEAITRFGATRLRPDLARAHLLFGEWLRRQNRLTEAREHLRHVHVELAGMGMEGYAQRARAELAASGERTRADTPRTPADLTAQELRIARLVAEGATNPQIASRLFISTRTVEYHLHKVFRKLGISSRTRLAKHIFDMEPQTADSTSDPMAASRWR